MTANVLGESMADLERPERLQIMLSPDELEALENWRFEKRMPSRASAGGSCYAVDWRLMALLQPDQA